jgi:hypothetical protein
MDLLTLLYTYKLRKENLIEMDDTSYVKSQVKNDVVYIDRWRFQFLILSPYCSVQVTWFWNTIKSISYQQTGNETIGCKSRCKSLIRSIEWARSLIEADSSMNAAGYQ